MAKKNDTTFFENKLLDFITAKDPMLEMLQKLPVILKFFAGFNVVNQNHHKDDKGSKGNHNKKYKK